MTPPRLPQPNGHLPEPVSIDAWQRIAAEPRPTGHGKPPTVIRVTAAQALGDRSFDALSFVIPGYVVPGLTLLAGKPKSGKSWLALGWALAVAHGGVAMGNVSVERGSVLYLALEDNERRLQARMKQVSSPDKSLPANLLYATEWRTGTQAIDDLHEQLTKMKDNRLVIVDVFAKIKAPMGAKNGDLYGYDYAVASPLKKLADEHSTAIVAVHHVSKRTDLDDPFDAVSGTTGLTGACDSVLILSRDRQGGVRLYGRGRDLQEIDTALNFDQSTGAFTVLGAADSVRQSDERKLIMKVLMDAPLDMTDGLPSAMSPRDIATVGGFNQTSVRQMVLRMALDGQIIKTGRGAYRAIVTPVVTPEPVVTPGESQRQWWAE